MSRTKIDEPVAVWVTEGGTPERLVWQNRRWVITDRPTLWVDRDRWWELSATQGPRQPTSGFPVWRAQISPLDAAADASADTSESSVVVDIAHRHNQWLIINVFG